MPVISPLRPESIRALAWLAALAVLAASMLVTAAGAAGRSQWVENAPVAALEEGVEHLVISEVMTGGGSASDEFIEVYNPTPGALPLEGLELIYVSASGATITRKAEWAAGAALVPPGAHLLVANEAGALASMADLTYANGLAASGGSVAIRIQGASSPVDAVGWGTATGTWLEGTPSPPPAAGQSLERLPGGSAGSGQDTDQNSVDFIVQPAPGPQNAASFPIDLGSPSPSPTATDAPSSTLSASPTPAPTTPAPTASPTPVATPSPLTIADARALPDGTEATVEGVSLTDGAFTDGGGYLVDPTGGIAVLVADGSFPRGHLLRVTGQLDGRYHQRTLRTSVAKITVLGAADDPPAQPLSTGAVGEAVEGELIVVEGAITSSPSELSGGLAFDLDDGSGSVRLVVYAVTGIDAAGWERGTPVHVRGVVGQRDSTGGGASGYRLQPRDSADVLAATASATPSASVSPSASPTPDSTVVSIADARGAAINTRFRVRGVVTLPSSLLGDGTAAIQDATGAIILRLGDEAGDVAMGELVQVDGVRSTMSGMETLRISSAVLRLGTQPQPQPMPGRTGELGEAHEARLVVVRGLVTTSPRRTSAQNVYFDVDDGSGPLRVYLSPRTGIGAADVVAGSWIQVIGVLGQETAGQQPLRGYRLWPRVTADVTVATPTSGDASLSSSADPGIGGGGVRSPAGGPDAGPSDGSSGSQALPQLAVPRLVASRLALALPTSTPPRGDPAESRRLPATGPNRMVVPLLLLTVLAAGGGAVGAARQGLVGRLRRALERLRAGSVPSEADEGTGRPGAPMEDAIGRLLPLTVVDGARAQASSTDVASGTRRILPPT